MHHHRPFPALPAGKKTLLLVALCCLAIVIWPDRGPVQVRADGPTAGGAQIAAFTTIYLPLVPNAANPAESNPNLDFSPISFDESPDWGATTVRTLTLANHGPAVLNFELAEVGGRYAPPGTPDGSPLALPANPADKVEPQVWTRLAAADDGQTGVFVIFRQQADLRPAYTIPDWQARGQFVLGALRKTAQASQAQALVQLQNFVRQGQAGRVRPYYIVNAVYVSGSAEVVEAMAARPDVAAVRAAGRHPLPQPVPGQAHPATADNVEWNIAQIGADRAWREFGVRGEGIVVANIDTGVRYTHQALVGGYRGNQGGGNFDHNYNWWDPDMIDRQPADDYGHGTHTMGTMAGDDGGGNQIGVAPGAQWIAAQGCDYGWCDETDLIEAAEWILAPWDLSGDRNTADPDRRPHVVNNSWGGYGGDDWYMTLVAAWRAAGIFPAFAIGNGGDWGCDTAGSPGDYPLSFATGATDRNDLIASFSSRGPSPFGGIKPDVSAPGVDVRSAGGASDSAYETYSGTSMASPHSAGLVALLWSADPGLLGQVAETATIIQGSVLAVADDECGEAGPPNNVYGWGRIDAYQALSQVARDLPWLVVEPAAGVVPAFGQMEVTVTFDASRIPQPGVYQAGLRLRSNDPTQPNLRLPLTMTVPPHPSMGRIEGAVGSDRPGGALAGAQVTASAGGTGVFSGTTDVSGRYGPWWLMEGGYTITVSAAGYLVDAQAVSVSAGLTTTHAVTLALDAPQIELAPAALELSLVEGEQSRQTLNLGNVGAGTLTFEITETTALPGGGAQPAQLQGQTRAVRESKDASRESGPEGGSPSASGGPDPFGYTYRDSTEAGGPVYDWIEIAPPAGGQGNEVPGLGGMDDGYYWPLALPFAFNFYGTDYDRLAVASNGSLYFVDDYLGYGNGPIPGATFYGVDRFIAHFWDDLVINPGAVYYQIEAERVIIEYYQVSGYGDSEHGTWQVILFANGNILFQYQDTTVGGYRDHGRWATVGIQGDAATGLQYSYNSPALSDGLAICFAAPGGPPDCALYGDVPWLSASPAAGTVSPGGALPLEVTVDAADLTTGVYTAALVILSDDPGQAALRVPVVLHVEPCQTAIALDPPQAQAVLAAGPLAVTAVISNATDLGGFEVALGYDPAIVHVEGVSLAPFPGSTGRTIYPVGPTIDNRLGRVSFGAFSSGGAPGPDGTGAIATLTLSPQQPGLSPLDLWGAQSADTSGRPAAACALDGRLSVTECFAADLDCDCDVDLADVSAVESRWGCRAGQSCYEPGYDLDGDGDIDVVDAMQVAAHLGWACAAATDFELQATAPPLAEAGLRLAGLPAVRTVAPGQTLSVDVILDNAVELGGFEVELAYDPGLLRFEGMAMGDLPGRTGREVHSLGPEVDPEAGRVRFGGLAVGTGPGASGDGLLARLTFTTLAEGRAGLVVEAARLTTVDGASQPVSWGR